MEDVVFAKGEVEIGVLPIGPAEIGTQKQLAADHGSVGPRLVGGIGGLDHALKAPGQNFRSPRLADDIDRASVESQTFIGRRCFAS